MRLVLLRRCPDPARRCTSRTSGRRSRSRSRGCSRSSRRRSGSTGGVRISSSGSGGRSSGSSSCWSRSDHRATCTARAACATDAHRAAKVVSKVVGSEGDHRDGLGGGGASRRLDHPCRLRRDPPRGSCGLLCDILLDYPCGHRRLLREGGAGGAEETHTGRGRATRQRIPRGGRRRRPAHCQARRRPLGHRHHHDARPQRASSASLLLRSSSRRVASLVALPR